MDYERLLKIGDQCRFPIRLSSQDKVFICETVPEELHTFPNFKYPSHLKHPGGFTISGAVVRSFIKCALVLAGRRALGVQYYRQSEFYDHVARELTLGMTLSHFHHSDPKGAYCCAQCTLALYPVLKAGALRWVNCIQLASAVRSLIEDRKWRFTTSTNPRMITWSLSENT